MKNETPSITRIKVVYHALDELKDKVVFVGGAVVALYAQRDVQEPRPTDDIDIIVEILNYKEQAELDDKLRHKGFVNDIESGITCRYLYHGITVDVMPTTDRSFGFQSMWYASGFQNAESFSIDDQHTIRILSAPYYLATKIEAFHDRGQNDGRTSQDFEDIVFILEHRPSIWNELKLEKSKLKSYMAKTFRQWLMEENIFEWIDAHVERNEVRSTTRILTSIENFIKSNLM